MSLFKPSRLIAIALILLLAGVLLPWLQNKNQPQNNFAPPSNVTNTAQHNTLPNFLPPQAHTTITLIQHGGPYPYHQDNSTFSNRERHLPQKPHGYYREYTVKTPGERTRGARRIVTGGNPPIHWYYTDDHYRSFRPFQIPNTTTQH